MTLMAGEVTSDAFLYTVKGGLWIAVAAPLVGFDRFGTDARRSLAVMWSEADRRGPQPWQQQARTVLGATVSRAADLFAVLPPEVQELLPNRHQVTLQWRQGDDLPGGTVRGLLDAVVDATQAVVDLSAEQSAGGELPSGVAAAVTIGVRDNMDVLLEEVAWATEEPVLAAGLLAGLVQQFPPQVVAERLAEALSGALLRHGHAHLLAHLSTGLDTVPGPVLQALHGFAGANASLLLARVRVGDLRAVWAAALLLVASTVVPDPTRRGSVEDRLAELLATLFAGAQASCR